ncbi:MAG: MTAP family purine nucleoside phosphorylase [Euryarchaeota archaeon]|jgi:purine nucleoside phosphorylase|nr:MTAP family purine nucleoside phosphorylase [Euryarchaeota archaeon]MBT3654318.1 MTAP family purine nucleoside phosphorylase [Euryarchaeota archaeon]MBT3757446.1 MTAP family purine nucleoside phosphorylase [Euryarchaeota archaeon]MBT4050538.1 MTAP family purine nucleoside phosphorylase [Euryarchaeota archaeon]MBT4346164.1 MTAP family purine nucleoside phosphorylase [Euryarchaeota archaeon]
MTRIAILCGTGMSSLADDFIKSAKHTVSFIRVSSEWGDVPLNLVTTNQGKFVFIDRHHSPDDSRTAPHEIEHRANVHAAASTNPDLIISINSVGSMNDELPPGNIGIAGDVLDLSIRPWSFHNDDTHFDRTSPFDEKAISIAFEALSTQDSAVIKNLIVAQCIGPQFETAAEIDALEKLGADVIGMTLGPEQRLVCETGIPHLALCCSSNWAAGREPGAPLAPIDHHSVDAMAATLKSKISLCLDSLINNY